MRNFSLPLRLLSFTSVMGFILTQGVPVAPAGSHEGQRLFEMRTYTAHDGKLNDLLARFRNHTNHLFVKHGMSVIGYWIPAEVEAPSNPLIYILAFPSRDAREASWKAFREDPEWKAAYADSIKNGKLVKEIEAEILEATDFSPIQ